MIKRLEWESNFFNKEIYTFDFLEEINFNLNRRRIYIKEVDFNLVAEKEKLKNLNFKHIDDSITLSKNIKKMKSTNLESIKSAKVKDFNKIKKIIKGMYKYSRFYEIESTKVDCFYEKWLENAIKKKFDDICFFIEENSEVLGFVTGRVENKIGKIGLIGVNSKYRSLGLGKILLNKINDYFFENNCIKLLVSTQGKNKAAIKFYLKNDFEIYMKKSWFYLKERSEND